MNQPNKDLNRDPNRDKQIRQRFQWFWWLVLIGLIVWNFITLFPRANPQVNLAYSDFQAQVKAGNVKSVNINDTQITGQFVGPYHVAATDNAPAQDYTQFTTTFPGTIGDTSLIPLLNSKNVQINVAPPPSPWFQLLLTYGLPLILLVLLMVWMGRNAMRSQSGIFKMTQSKAREYKEERTGVTFADVAGVNEAKTELMEVVDFLKNPKKYHELGARIPRGVLLVGPPGTGKTLLARAVAGEASVPFFSISASEFVEMFVGVGAGRVRDLFDRAKKAAPAIVFIDELDAVGRRRGAGVGNINDEREQTLNQLLVEMDGFDEHQEVIVLAATNRPDVLDPALLRPGRFDRQVTVSLPDSQGREGILRIHTQKLTLAPDVNLNLLARTTTGFSGADLANLCNEAALVAARENSSVVKMEHFEKALDRILLGETRSLLLNEHDRQVVAYHEAGHAVVAWLTPMADPVNKVTIIPRGRALGVTEQIPGEDQFNYSREYLLARLSVMMGGRVAEEIAMHDITTGAENDLVEASKLARRMITRWGMGELGLMAIATDDEQPFLGYELAQSREVSDKTAARIDENVQKLLQARHDAVMGVLSENRRKLDDLARALLKEETISREGIEKILGPRAYPDATEAGVLPKFEKNPDLKKVTKEVQGD